LITRATFIPALLGALLLADASAEQAEIDEVLVTATRRTISTAEISSALTLVDGAAARTSKLVTDGLDTQVGVFLQQTTPGQGAAIIRGLKGSAVLHLVDGIRLNNAIFRSAPTQYFALVPTSALERIEILRGTPASLYGSDAVGGVVQLVTRVPEFDGPETQFGGEAFAAFDSAELGKIVRGTLDAGSEKLATSLSAEYLETGDRRTGSGDRIGPSGYESWAARNSCRVSAKQSRHRRNSCSNRTAAFSCAVTTHSNRAGSITTGTSTLPGNALTTIERRGISVRRSGAGKRIAVTFTGS
jgi:outer membrane receptor protein involved in Fe transport